MTVPEMVRFPDTKQPCIVCGRLAEFSTVGTPTCSVECLVKVPFPDIPEEGLSGKPPPQVYKWPRPAYWKPKKGSVERALEQVGTCAEVLKRWERRVRGRMAFCPFHPNTNTPAMSLYTRKGFSKAKCHACGWSGGALDLEAALAEEPLEETIRRFS